MIVKNQMTLWTIGHANHDIKTFLALLNQHQIQALADIRRFPGSRKFPQFNCEKLAITLKSHEIEYQWFEDLGGRRSKSMDADESPNGGWRNSSFRNYADYMLSSRFHVAFMELEALALAQRTAIMCAESVFWRCHRRLVSDYAVATGGRVNHIFPNGQVKPHSLTSEAVVEDQNPCRIVYPAAPTLFD
ncbi:hypothetical protein Fuma_01746 [Fuerstiella marisgermanici]|uniref:DUF488 domain-containing protein n=2 Tax=Fuerstiella marisgermanici TaxID=1891926 RepID=A0A1P8WDN5_9PLAN|nr:hypothetical protein Fuma_01746 [Fuerstiella marisgermanici]